MSSNQRYTLAGTFFFGCLLTYIGYFTVHNVKNDSVQFSERVGGRYRTQGLMASGINRSFVLSFNSHVTFPKNMRLGHSYYVTLQLTDLVLELTPQPFDAGNRDGANPTSDEKPKQPSANKDKSKGSARSNEHRDRKDKRDKKTIEEALNEAMVFYEFAAAGVDVAPTGPTHVTPTGQTAIWTIRPKESGEFVGVVTPFRRTMPSDGLVISPVSLRSHQFAMQVSRFTFESFILRFLGPVLTVPGLVAFVAFIAGRLKARRERKEKEEKDKPKIITPKS
ncbi:hypothetical protein OAH18_01090 [bacterium]|nr:hypothetical protein [bacterium]